MPSSGTLKSPKKQDEKQAQQRPTPSPSAGRGHAGKDPSGRDGRRPYRSTSDSPPGHPRSC